MILSQTQPLNPAKRSQLVRWLNQPESVLLLDQINALSAESQVKASESLIEGESEASVMAGHVDDAKFYRRCASLLSAMAVKSDSGLDEFDFHTLEMTTITSTTPIP